jgi:hypothetical protein
MKKPFAALLFLSAALLSVQSAVAQSMAAQNAAVQTAVELERLLTLPAVSYGDAAWLVLNAAGTALPGAPLPALAERSASGAYRFAVDNNWLPKNAGEEEPVTLGGISLLIMKALTIKGGFMYTLFPGPRYAYRELTYRKIIPGRAYSTMTVSGERLLRILSRALDYSGDTESLAEETARRQLQEEVRASLDASAREHEGVSAGSEGILEYDNEFVPE